MIEQVPAQAIYVPQQGELELAWYLFLGSALWLAWLWTMGKRPTKKVIVSSVLCAAIGYGLAIEVLEYSLTVDGWLSTLANFPNFFAAFVGFTSHNLPDLFGLLYNKVKKRAG